MSKSERERVDETCLPRSTAPNKSHLLSSWHSEVQSIQDGAVWSVAEVYVLKSDGGIVWSDMDGRSPRFIL